MVSELCCELLEVSMSDREPFSMSEPAWYSWECEFFSMSGQTEWKSLSGQTRYSTGELSLEQPE